MLTWANKYFTACAIEHEEIQSFADVFQIQEHKQDFLGYTGHTSTNKMCGGSSDTSELKDQK